jgi:hypothetical protein
MKFLVFQCSQDHDYFVVTDEAHVNELSGSICPSLDFHGAVIY